MSVGAKVDALALMLDGTCNADGYRPPGLWVEDLVRNGGRSWLAIRRDNGNFHEVAEAILELEGNADAWMGPGRLCSNGSLALQALDAAPEHGASFEHIAMRYLEAAALLRDGWRPSDWKAGSR